FVDAAVAVSRAITFGQPFDQRIVDAPSQERHRVAVNRMRVDRQLPRADVAGQQDHAAPFGHRAEVIFQAFVDDYRRDVFAVKSWELADLAEQSSEVAEHAAPDMPAFALIETGEGQPQVDLRVAAQMRQNRAGERPDRSPGP